MKVDYLYNSDVSQQQQDGPCLYTVSVDPVGIRDDGIIAGYNWVLQNFESVVCLIGDGPLIARTAEITGVDQATVTRHAFALSQRMTGVTFMSDLAEDDDFQSALAEVQRTRAISPSFSLALTKDAVAYVERVRRRGDLAVPLDHALKLSEEYIANEVAMYLCEGRRGLLVDAYVGNELPILQKFISGEISGVLSPLERRVFISLKPEA